MRLLALDLMRNAEKQGLSPARRDELEAYGQAV
jgi:hypothetical protein